MPHTMNVTSITPQTVLVCPHCDSTRIDPMAPRTHEEESRLTWYECRDCTGIWNVDKDPEYGGESTRTDDGS